MTKGIGESIKNFLLSILSFLSPYLMKCLVAVALPLFLKSLMAVLTKDQAEIDKAKAEIAGSWDDYIKESQIEATGTQSLIDDVVFGYLGNTEADDKFVDGLFDKAVEFEQKFFPIA